MTPILLIGFVLLLSVGLALVLLRLRGRSGQPGVDIPGLLQRPRAAELYRPVARLLTQQDVTFLRCQEGCRPGMVRRLRRQHRRVRSLYLRQIRRDFAQISAACWQLSLRGRSADFAALVVRQYLLFHGLYGALRVRRLLGDSVPFPVDAFDLVCALDRLQESARHVLRPLSSELPTKATPTRIS